MHAWDRMIVFDTLVLRGKLLPSAGKHARLSQRYSRQPTIVESQRYVAQFHLFESHFDEIS
jgi:hypothetical protein